MLRSVQAYHQDARGYDDIAYNFVVDRFGRIWEGRAGGTTNVVRRRAQPGLQHRRGGCRRARRLPDRRCHVRDVRVDGAGDRLEVRAPSGRSRAPRCPSRAPARPSTPKAPPSRCAGSSATATCRPRAARATNLIARLPALRTRVAAAGAELPSRPGSRAARPRRHRRPAHRPVRVPARRRCRRAVASERVRRVRQGGRSRLRRPTDRRPATSTATASTTCSGTAAARRPTRSGGSAQAGAPRRPCRSAARTSRSSTTSTATAPTTSSGTPPVWPPTRVWYFRARPPAPLGGRGRGPHHGGPAHRRLQRRRARRRVLLRPRFRRDDSHVAEHGARRGA